jgi:DNA invertase Pin-like site-specific DNA recombinase
MTTTTTTTRMTTAPAAGSALLGYSRVSTPEQDHALQLDALAEAGCLKTWSDTASGVAAPRPQLASLLEYARAGDVLVVWRLDRLGRSLRELVELVERLHHVGVGLRSLTEGIDTTTPAGRLMLHVFAALAEFEREVIRERTRAGLAAATARGRRGGRPTVMPEAKTAAAVQMHDAGASLAQIAAALGVSKTTIRRHLPAAV